jgi:hypothetical protein
VRPVKELGVLVIMLGKFENLLAREGEGVFLCPEEL